LVSQGILILVKTRSTEAELMDDGITSFDTFDTCLQQIEKVNGWTLGYRPVFLWLEKNLSRATQRPLMIIDVGCGRGELLRRIWRWCEERNIEVSLTGIDINPWSKHAAEKATPPEMNIRYETADIFKEGNFMKADFIICSHVTHHLKDEELTYLLQWLNRYSWSGWLINDLHRHFLPHFFIKCFLSLLPVHPIVRNDGPASVRKAFIAADWRELIEKARIPASAAKIQWFFPFRYAICRVN
jgi:SAM-dependent methyltransferase